MRHQKAGTKLNRTGSHRNAMFRNMVTSLFEHGRIHTTDAKAKELRRWADQVITLAKRGDLHARRQALSIVRSKAVVHKLFEDVAGRFGQRAGGYTRVVKLGKRLGDAAPVSLVEFVAPEDTAEKKKSKRKTSKKTAEQKGTQEKKKDSAETKGKKAAEKSPEAATKPAGGSEQTQGVEADTEKAESPSQHKAEGEGTEDKGDEE